MMHVFDVSDKTNPIELGSWNNVPSAHACWVSEDGYTLFTASETGGGHVISWDVSDLENVNFLDEWYPEGGEEWSVHNIFVKGNYLFMSYYAYGLQIIDVEDPSNLLLSGYYDTYNQYIPGAIFNGAWGAYPYFNTNKVVVSDRSSGLYVVEFNPDNIIDISGDINQDGWLDVLDIVLIVGIIMEDYVPTEYEFIASDINQDNIIDILDIISLINIILG